MSDTHDQPLTPRAKRVSELYKELEQSIEAGDTSLTDEYPSDDFDEAAAPVREFKRRRGNTGGSATSG